MKILVVQILIKYLSYFAMYKVKFEFSLIQHCSLTKVTVNVFTCGFAMVLMKNINTILSLKTSRFVRRHLHANDIRDTSFCDVL